MTRVSKIIEMRRVLSRPAIFSIANFDVLALTVDTITGGNRECDLRPVFDPTSQSRTGARRS